MIFFFSSKLFLVSIRGINIRYLGQIATTLADKKDLEHVYVSFLEKLTIIRKVQDFLKNVIRYIYFLNVIRVFLISSQKICVSEMILRAAKKYFKIHLRQGKTFKKVVIRTARCYKSHFIIIITSRLSPQRGRVKKKSRLKLY